MVVDLFKSYLSNHSQCINCSVLSTAKMVYGVPHGSKTMPAKLNNFFPVNILGNLLSPAEVVRNLGVFVKVRFFPLLQCWEYL